MTDNLSTTKQTLIDRTRQLQDLIMDSTLDRETQLKIYQDLGNILTKIVADISKGR